VIRGSGRAGGGWGVCRRCARVGRQEFGRHQSRKQIAKSAGTAPLALVSIGGLGQVGTVLFAHGAEKMLGMLIEILCFDGVAVHERGPSQCEVALVLPLGISERMATTSLGVRRTRL
jgi:hypothetical protein